MAMQYRADPQTKTPVSALGLGCMRLPGYATGRIDVDAAERVVLRALERGVNYLDCAYVYRGVEDAVGRILERNRARDRALLATKLPHGQVHVACDLDRLLGTSLGRLRTQRVDYYLVHNLTSLAQWQALVALGIEEWVAREKAAGRIGRIGFSFHGALRDFEQILDAYPWEFCQIQYNYANENYQAGTAGLRKAAARGMAVFVMEPLLGGKLAGGLPKGARTVLRAADERAGRTPASPASWGLRWVWDHPEVTMLLSGMSTVEQVDENCAIAEDALPGCLDARDRAAVGRAVEEFNRTNRVPCTGCGYCLPCPRNVNIPGSFAAYNASFAFGRLTGLQQYMTASSALGDHPRLASACVGCGACSRRCPQHIDIPACLRDVRRRLEPAPARLALKAMARIKKQNTAD